MRVEVAILGSLTVLMTLTVSVDVKQIEPCLRTGHNLSPICQPTSEDIKLYIIIIACTLRAQELCESRGVRPGLPSLKNLRFLWT